MAAPRTIARWRDKLEEVFPLNEGYRINVSTHDYMRATDERFSTYNRIAVFSTMWQTEIFTLVGGNARDFSTIAYPNRAGDAAALEKRIDFLRHHWPRRVPPVPTYGGVFHLHQVILYGFEPCCIDPTCPAGQAGRTCGSHQTEYRWGYRMTLYLDPASGPALYPLHGDERFVPWLRQWKRSFLRASMAIAVAPPNPAPGAGSGRGQVL